MRQPTLDELAKLYVLVGGIAQTKCSFHHFCPTAYRAASGNLCGYDYKTWYVPKKNGSQRRIDEPCGRLKEIQRALLPHFQAVPQGNWVFGLGGCKKSARHNAQMHMGHKVVVQMDIQNFFPSTSYEQCAWILQDRAELQVALAFCFIQDKTGVWRLPQGAPTSPVLANIGFLEVDAKIIEYCDKRNITYTRYMDDMTFSAPAYPVGLQRDITAIVAEESEYKINPRKNKVCYKANDQQVVTGVCINSVKPTVTRTFKRRLRAALDQCARTEQPLTEQLQGKLAYLQSIQPDQYEKFLKYFFRRQQRFTNAPNQL